MKSVRATSSCAAVTAASIAATQASTVGASLVGASSTLCHAHVAVLGVQLRAEPRVPVVVAGAAPARHHDNVGDGDVGLVEILARPEADLGERGGVRRRPAECARSDVAAEREAEIEEIGPGAHDEARLVERDVEHRHRGAGGGVEGAEQRVVGERGRAVDGVQDAGAAVLQDDLDEVGEVVDVHERKHAAGAGDVLGANGANRLDPRERRRAVATPDHAGTQDGAAQCEDVALNGDAPDEEVGRVERRDFGDFGDIRGRLADDKEAREIEQKRLLFGRFHAAERREQLAIRRLGVRRVQRRVHHHVHAAQVRARNLLKRLQQHAARPGGARVCRVHFRSHHRRHGVPVRHQHAQHAPAHVSVGAGQQH
jgi:hypothetical protein